MLAFIGTLAILSVDYPICYHLKQSAPEAPPVRGKGLSHSGITMLNLTSFQPVFADSGSIERRSP